MIKHLLLLGSLAIAGCANNVTKEEFTAYIRDAEKTKETLKAEIEATQKKTIEANLRHDALIKKIEDISARMSVGSLDNYAIALEQQTTQQAKQYLQLARNIADLHKKTWNLGNANKLEIDQLRAETKNTDETLAEKFTDLKKTFEETQKEYETFKEKAPDKPNVETYRCPLTYESPLIAQMLPGMVKAAYQRALKNNQQNDWAVYEIAARFFIDQNIDTAPHDGSISNDEYKKFVSANPDLEVKVTPDKIADQFKVEFPESYKEKWLEIRAKINRLADMEQKNRWSDIEFVRYAVMPGMIKTPDSKGYYTSKTYSDYFEGRVNKAIEELTPKK
jgi:hypothetical protein